ncbi:MAG: DUF2628 domain-containing protein [Alphaproteobacteria bacterium]|nr:DUF2628 domain-containing protein [Alphaproteobacteria bacterium]
MRIYTIHRRGRGILEEPEICAVKEGFCWPALLFGPLWAAWRGDWAVAAALLAALAAAAVFADALFWLSLPVLLLIALTAGFEGNEFARRRLARRGFAETALAAGRNAGEAEARFRARSAP